MNSIGKIFQSQLTLISKINCLRFNSIENTNEKELKNNDDLYTGRLKINWSFLMFILWY